MLSPLIQLKNIRERILGLLHPLCHKHQRKSEQTKFSIIILENSLYAAQAAPLRKRQKEEFYASSNR